MKNLIICTLICWLNAYTLPAQDCGVIYSGEGTFYGYGGGGNCSFPNPTSPVYTGAMNEVQYDSSSICGACAEVTGSKGSLVIRIEDRCPECKYGDIDLSEEAFAVVDDKIKGRVPISWKIVPCPVVGAVKFYFKEGSSQWWTAVQIRNHKYPVAKLEYKVNNQWVTIPRAMYNYFVVEPGMGTGPYDFRITDLFGHVIEETNIPLIVTTSIDGTNQFPDCSGGNPVPVSSVSISGSTSVNVGSTIHLTADIIPSNATNKSVSWSSGNTSVATVSSAGVVTGISAGTATISVTTQDGNKTAGIDVTVTGATTPCSFGTPASTALPTLNGSYAKAYVLGTGGPNLSNITTFTINWDLQGNGLWQFSANTSNGQPTWWLDLRTVATWKFNQPQPEVTLSGSGFPGFDGSYWVTTDGGNFVMVSKNSGFAVYFSNSATEPSCTKGIEEISATSIKGGELFLYPNPFCDKVTLLLNNAEKVTGVEIYDQSGRLVLTIPGNEILNRQGTFGEELTPGMYFVKVTGKSEAVYKIVKVCL